MRRGLGAIRPRLVLLSLRRSASPGLLLIALLLCAALGLNPVATPEPLLGGPSGGAAARGLAREGIWSAFLLVIAPILLARSAATVSGWRRGESAWLASAPLSRAAILGSTWIGAALASLALLMLAGLAAELRARTASESGPAWTLAGTLPMPRTVLLQPSSRMAWRVELPLVEDRAQVRLHLLLAGGGPKADVRFSARRAGGGGVELARRVSGRQALVLALPPGEGPVDFELARAGPGSIVVAEPARFELLVPVGDERLASLSLWLRCWLALAAAQALALGLGAWMGSGLATALVLTACASTWLASEASRLWPWADLPGALRSAGEGLVPSLPSLATAVGAALALASGIGLGAAGLRSWSRAP